MKILLLPLLLSLSCSQLRSPAHVGNFETVSFKTQRLDKESIRGTYPNLSSQAFEEKFNNSLDRPLMFFRSYVNTYYSETLVRGPLKTPVFCYGDPHPENFGFLSFAGTSQYVFNDLDDSGYCPIGLDILRYFSALRLTTEDEEMISRLANVFIETVQGNNHLVFDFKRPDLGEENLSNLRKYTSADRFIEKKNVILLDEEEKIRIKKEIKNQFRHFKILDIARYEKNDGGSAGLSRYWFIVENAGHKELIEIKQLTNPAVSWSGIEQEFDRTLTPRYIWGKLPDYYGHVVLDGKLYLTRSKADDYIDLNKLKKKEQFKLLSYQVQLLAFFHRENLNKLGGTNASWIIEGSKVIADRYQEAFQHYQR